MGAYADFISAGNTDSDWEAFQANANALRRANGWLGIQTKWSNNELQSGSSIYRFLVEKNVYVERALSNLLQDDDTQVSRDTIVARGLTRKRAKYFVEYINELMAQAIYPEP
jgi:hypothetical protein